MTTQDTIICQRAIHSARRVDIPLTKKARRAGLKLSFQCNKYARIDVNRTREKFSARFVPRVEWEARNPNGITNFQIPARHGLIGHHTAGSHCTTQSSCISNMKGTQNYHMDSLGWSDIGYNFLIGEDGRIYEVKSSKSTLKYK